MLDLISSSVSCGMRPWTSRPDLGAERPDRCALDVNRYAALTEPRLSDGTPGAARCRQALPL